MPALTLLVWLVLSCENLAQFVPGSTSSILAPELYFEVLWASTRQTLKNIIKLLHLFFILFCFLFYLFTTYIYDFFNFFISSAIKAEVEHGYINNPLGRPCIFLFLPW